MIDWLHPYEQSNRTSICINVYNDKDFLIKFEKKTNKVDTIENIKENLTKSIGDNFDFRRVENVGPKVSAELLKSGIIAISLALAVMLIYIWIRFEWQFSLGAILALFHDVIVTLGIFSFFNLEIKNSIPSIVPIGLIILLRTFIFDKSSFSKSNSSLLVPDLVISKAG